MLGSTWIALYIKIITLYWWIYLQLSSKIKEIFIFVSPLLNIFWDFFSSYRRTKDYIFIYYTCPYRPKGKLHLKLYTIIFKQGMKSGEGSELNASVILRPKSSQFISVQCMHVPTDYRLTESLVLKHDTLLGSTWITLRFNIKILTFYWWIVNNNHLKLKKISYL